MKRLTRAEQSERNRGLVLAAARRVFLARGYHGATLEQIADEAGFSKGVVYSQFESKAGRRSMPGLPSPCPTAICWP
jgi:AcrR family transcriptional regulator